MINPFHIPTHVVDTGKFSNLLSDKIVREFEERFAEYVGAKYAVSFNSATSAIFLLYVVEDQRLNVKIPSILPPVVANAILTAHHDIEFTDNIDWVGGSYLLDTFDDLSIVDSAHRVDKDQFSKEAKDNDLMIFSFFPTKPVSGSDGGMIVSNNLENIESLRELANNGMSQEVNSWERKQSSVGFKMYMNSFQAYIANENLKRLDYKKIVLANIRHSYNHQLALTNTSDHLYRIPVQDNREFVKKAKEAGIECGIHYQALHQNPIFSYTGEVLPKSDQAAKTMVSLPFHERLSVAEIKKVIEFVKANRE